MLETWSLLGRFGSPENPVSIGLVASGLGWNKSWFIREELLGELEARRSSLGRALGASLLSPVKSKAPSSRQPGERSCCWVLMPGNWGGELDITGDPTVRFSFEVEEEDTLSDLNRLELLGSKTLKGRASSISTFSNEDILESRAACLVT